MLFRCSPVALVVNPLMGPMEAMGASTNEPLHKSHKIVIWDDLKQRSMIELEFSHEIKAVKLRRDKIIVVLPQMVKVYTFTSSPTQLNVYDTAPNQKGKFFFRQLFVYKIFVYIFSLIFRIMLIITYIRQSLACIPYNDRTIGVGHCK